MKVASLLLIAILAFDVKELWQRMTRETNSRRAAERGVVQYEKKKYDQSVESLRRAQAIAPTPRNAFNLGTAEVASGKREQGSATLGKAMADPSLRATALYNRGNSALGANAWDQAIHDYVESLRLDPARQQAKRNLEIALKKKESEQRSRSGGDRNPQGGAPQPRPREKKEGTGGEEEDEKRQEADAEALLRSVQQQEQEELSRMRKSRPEPRRIGW